MKHNPLVIHRHLQSMAKEAFFRGAVLIGKKDEILLSEGYGPKNTSSTLLHIGSITKQFTAALILELGVDCNAEINSFFPPVDAWEGIKVKHLLSHTSGIPNYTDWEDYRRICKKLNVEKILKRTCGECLNFKPGSDFEYCNTGYLILGVIIEEVTGKKYGEVLDELLKRAGMLHSGVENEKKFSNVATGYCLNDRGDDLIEDHSENISATLSDGAMYSTVEDMFKWSRILDGKGGVLSKETIRQMTTPHKEGFGYGLAMGKLYGSKTIFHSGTVGGFNADFCKFPDEELTIVVLGNNIDYNAKHVTGEIAKWYFKGDDAVSEAIPFPSDFDFSSYTGEFRSDLDDEAEIEMYVRKKMLFLDDGRPTPCILLTNGSLFNPVFGTEYELNRDGTFTVYDCYDNKVDLMY